MTKPTYFQKNSIILFIVLACLQYLYSSPTESANLSVVNINIWSGLNYEGIIKMGEVESRLEYERRYKTLIIQLKELDVDIITMQEVNPLPSKAKIIAHDLDMDFISHVSEAGIKIGSIGLPTNLRQGDAIFAKKELNLEWVGRKRTTGGFAENFLSYHFDDGSQVIAGKIHLNDQSIIIFTTHWHASVPDLKKYRQMATEFGQRQHLKTESIHKAQNYLKLEAEWRFTEAQGTIDYIQSICGNSLPYILTGDFNATVEMPELHILDSLKMKDVFAELNPNDAGITWDAENNSNVKMQYPFKKEAEIFTIQEFLDNRFNLESYRIDYIFYHPGNTALKATQSRVVLNFPNDGIYPSDHYGVYANFLLPQKDEGNK